MPRHSLKVKKWYKAKFYSSTVRSRLLPVLRHMDAGNYPAKIARTLGVSKQHLHYYIRKMREAGLIKRSKIKWPAFYSLTPRGKKLLTRCERVAPGFLFRLHNVVFKYALRGPAADPAGWTKIRKRNWTAAYGKELGVRVEKTSRSVLIYCDVVEGYNPDELRCLAKGQADRIAATLRVKYGWRLGEGRQCRKAHFGVYDPVAALVSKYVQISDDIANIDQSETYGEIDWLTPKAAKDYLLMPGYVRRLFQLQREFAEGMADHRAMIKEIQAMTKETRELVEELRHQNKHGGS